MGPDGGCAHRSRRQHDPDGYGHVYHRAGSFAPGRIPLDALNVALDAAGDRAMTQQLRPGSIVLFYRSFSPGYLASQSITSVGVVEAVHQAERLGDLVRLTAKRSVYSEAKLAAFEATAQRPVKVIDFLLVGHIEPAIKLDDLRRMGVFRGAPPQSISQLTEARFEPVRNRMAFGFAV